MEKIEIAVSIEYATKRTIEINLPSKAIFFEKKDEGIFFPRGLILFAIIPKFTNKSGSYIILEIEQGKQNYNDFIPSTDCKDSYWLKTTGLRKQAFELMINNLGDFKEITKEIFEIKRATLLNFYQKLYEDTCSNCGNVITPETRINQYVCKKCDSDPDTNF